MVANPELRRSITWMHGVAMTIGAVLGSGVLALPILAAQLAGPASIISWLAMGVLAVPLTITLGRLAGLCPDAGGIAAYMARAFGPRAGVAAGWLFLGTVPIGAPVAALIGADYIGVSLSLSTAGVVIIASTMLGMALFFNYRGVAISAKVQSLVVVVIVAILLFIVSSAFGDVDRRAFIPFAPHGWPAVGSAMTVLFWAFVGWEMICHLAEEFRNPEKDISLSLGLSLIIVNLLYMALAVVVVGTGVYSGEAASLIGLVDGSHGQIMRFIIALLAFGVCYGTIHTYIAGFSRLVYAQSRIGALPRFLAVLHPSHGTPSRVFLALAPVFTLVMLITGLTGQRLDLLIQFTSSVFIAIYIAGMASAVKLLKGDRARIHAIISLVVCAVVYCFAGWACVYPAILGAVGWIASCRRSATDQENEGAVRATA